MIRILKNAEGKFEKVAAHRFASPHDFAFVLDVAKGAEDRNLKLEKELTKTLGPELTEENREVKIEWLDRDQIIEGIDDYMLALELEAEGREASADRWHNYMVACRKFLNQRLGNELDSYKETK